MQIPTWLIYNSLNGIRNTSVNSRNQLKRQCIMLKQIFNTSGTFAFNSQHYLPHNFQVFTKVLEFQINSSI